MWELGIDPGFGETALMLTNLREPKAWATFSCSARETPVNRAVSLADEVMDWVLGAIQRYRIEDLSIAIELPIYNQNPKAYELQFRLMQQIEAGILLLVPVLVTKCELIEFKPGTSKKLATGCGDASKDMIVQKMPTVVYRSTENLETRRSLADAWAHSLVARTDLGVHRIDMAKLKAAKVHKNMEALA